MDFTVYSASDESFLLPKLIQFSPRFCGASFFLMKLIPARFIVDEAIRSGQLTPGRSTVVETSSGTFGLALAMVCKLRGVHFHMVTDPVVDATLRRRIEDLGGTVDIVSGPALDGPGGVQQARLDRLAAVIASTENAFCPSQYDNPKNPGAYALLAEQLLTALGPIDCLVGPVGSGGSMCGTVKSLRTILPELRAIGVDTHHSVLFGHEDGKRMVRGLGNSLLPANLDHTVFDEVHWVDSRTSFWATRQLHREHALYMGPTSGPSYLVANWWARHHPDSTVVALLPDEGYRYQETVYNDDWLAEKELAPGPRVESPVAVDAPWDAVVPWSSFSWARRTFAEVMTGRPRKEPV